MYKKPSVNVRIKSLVISKTSQNNNWGNTKQTIDQEALRLLVQNTSNVLMWLQLKTQFLESYASTVKQKGIWLPPCFSPSSGKKSASSATTQKWAKKIWLCIFSTCFREVWEVTGTEQRQQLKENNRVVELLQSFHCEETTHGHAVVNQ